MLKLSKLAAIAIVGAIVSAPVFAADQSVATVNGVTIPQERMDLRLQAAARQGQEDSPGLRKAIREDLINLEVISQAATKKGLDKEADVVQELDLAKQSVLVGAYIKDYLKNHPISEDALKQEYEKLKARIGDKEYRVAHILVSSEKEAKSIEAQLKKNHNSFAKLAKEKSKDPGSAEHGGDLGWNPPSNFVKPFADAVLTLKKGQISAPVQSQFGWHIIKLEDERDLKVPPFEQVKPNMMRHLQQEAVQKLILDMRTNAKVE